MAEIRRVINEGIVLGSRCHSTGTWSTGVTFFFSKYCNGIPKVYLFNLTITRCLSDYRLHDANSSLITPKSYLHKETDFEFSLRKKRTTTLLCKQQLCKVYRKEKKEYRKRGRGEG